MKRKRKKIARRADKSARLETSGRKAHVHTQDCPDHGYACAKLWD